MKRSLRILCAILVSAIAAASLFPMLILILTFRFPWPAWVIAFPIALIHTIVLAIPTYSLSKRAGFFKWWSIALLGFVAGFLPLASISAIIFPNFNLTELYGYMELFGSSGMVGGLTAWGFLSLVPEANSKMTNENELLKS